MATGIGYDEQAYVFAFGELFFTVPQSIRVNLHGSRRPYPFGKDIILYLAGKYGDAFAQNHSLEFMGPLAGEMDLATRLTLADHAVEVGAKFGLFLADDKTHSIVMIGEIGGSAEEDAAQFLKDEAKKGRKKPMVGFIAGRTAPPGRRMGHAGAIIAGKAGTAQAKQTALMDAGATVVQSPSQIGATMAQVLKDRGLA